MYENGTCLKYIYSKNGSRKKNTSLWCFSIMQEVRECPLTMSLDLLSNSLDNRVLHYILNCLQNETVALICIMHK